MTLQEIMNSPLDKISVNKSPNDPKNYNITFDNDHIIVHINKDTYSPQDFSDMGISDEVITKCMGYEPYGPWEPIPTAAISFQRVNTDNQLSYVATGQGKQDLVFTGVKLALEDYLKENPDTLALKFSARGRSRIRLYKSLSIYCCRTWPGNYHMIDIEEDFTKFMILKDQSKKSTI